MFVKRRGSITVFICIVLAVLIPLCCILTDLARFSMARKQAETALKTCAESMLAAYDRQLKEQYGLFAMYPRSTEIMEQEIFELLSRNLNEGASADAVSDLYGFDVLKVDVVPIYNLSEPYVLKQQTAEFMKYRAPAQVIQEFYEKLKLMVSLKQEAEMIDKKMNLDRLMNDIRSSLVILHFMINEELPLFNKEPDGASGNLKDNKLDIISSNTSDASKEVIEANGETEPLKTAQNSYMGISPEYEAAEKNMNSAQDTLDFIESELEKVESDLVSAQTKAGTSSTNSAIQLEIKSLEAEKADKQEEYKKAEDTLVAAQREFRAIEDDLLQYKSQINTSTDIIISSLHTAILKLNESAIQLNIFLIHVTKHEAFHNDLLSTIDALTPSINEMDKQSSELEMSARSQEGSVSGRIIGDLEKQLKSIKKESFTEMRGQLSHNLERLKFWKQAASQCIERIDQTVRMLDDVKKSAEAVKAEPENKNNRYEGYSGFSQTEEALSALKTNLSDLKGLGQMQSVYAIPAYSLEPKPNSKEKTAFIQWFNEKYFGIEPMDDPAPKDESELSAIRSGVGSLAEIVGQQKEENPENEDTGVDLEDFAAVMAVLPSITGGVSSDEKLKKIGDAIVETADDQIIGENPLEKPVEGLEKVDEKDKNFFNYELQRIMELLETVKKFVAEGIESFAEDLYFNEYIVSAFENATAEDKIEHDIGWLRPLNKSFFKNAEVEYILFGKSSEKANISATRRSIFGVRLLFNLLHVYTDPDKLAGTLQLATSIAGWTIFGIPIVQNFLLIGWAGAESYVDVEVLSQGKPAPLIKTSSSWYLGLENLADYLKNILLNDIKKLAEDKIHESVDKLSETIQETVTSLINSKVDQAFGSVEKSLNEFVDVAAGDVQETVNSLVSDGLAQFIKFDDMDSLAASIEEFIKTFTEDSSSKLKNMAAEEILKYKTALKKSIASFIFNSPLYQALVGRLKATGDDLVAKGISAVEGQIDKALGMAGTSRKNNITARLVMMDYTDYLRLFLLAVPAEKKALRTADLMQLNIQQVSNNNDLSMGQYNTYVFIKAEMDFNTWFLPESFFKKKDAGMISIEWSQGY